MRRENLRLGSQADNVEHVVGAVSNKVAALEEIVSLLSYKADQVEKKQSTEIAVVSELESGLTKLKEQITSSPFLVATSSASSDTQSEHPPSESFNQGAHMFCVYVCVCAGGGVYCASCRFVVHLP